jgi:RHS repeat-associated protein
MAKVNPLRFSAKYQDDETDLLYYGCRYCNPITGRWLCRDPLADSRDPNQYSFSRNDPPNRVDPTGLYPISMVFDAFINGRRGDWLDEPFSGVPSGPSATEQYQFRTDLREFGAFSEGLRNGRLFSTATIDSEEIGLATSASDLLRGLSAAGESHRRSRTVTAITQPGSAGVGAPLIIGWSYGDWVYWDPRTAVVADPAPKVESPNSCVTRITFTPQAKYPYISIFGVNPSPNINYEVTFTLLKRTDVSAATPPVTVTLSGVHDNFPDYEAYVQGNLIYSRLSPGTGPNFMNLWIERFTIPAGVGVSLVHD